MKALCRLLRSNEGPKIKVTKSFLEELANAYNCETTPWEREYFPVEDIKTIELDKKLSKLMVNLSNGIHLYITFCYNE